MADIVTTNARSSGFIPDIWAAQALDVLRNNIVFTKLVARDSDYEPGWIGQTLTIPYPGTFSAQQKTENNLAAVQTPQNGGVVQITLNQHKYVDFIVEDLPRTQSSPELMNRYIQPAAIALAEDIESALIASALSNFTANPAVGTPGVDISASPIRAARRSLNAAKVPLSERHLVISPKDDVALLADSNLSTYYAFSQNDAIKEGNAGKLYGFDVHMSQLLDADDKNDIWTVNPGAASAGTFTITVAGQTTTAIAYNAAPGDVRAALEALTNIGGATRGVGSRDPDPIGVAMSGSNWVITTQGTHSGSSIGAWSVTDSTVGGPVTIAHTQTPVTANFAFHPNSLMIGFRPFRGIEPNAGVESSIMVDPMSGVAIRVMHWYAVQYRGHYIAYDVLYGISALRQNHGVLVLS